jgi:hypothetical protein
VFTTVVINFLFVISMLDDIEPCICFDDIVNIPGCREPLCRYTGRTYLHLGDITPEATYLERGLY